MIDSEALGSVLCGCQFRCSQIQEELGCNSYSDSKCNQAIALTSGRIPIPRFWAQFRAPNGTLLLLSHLNYIITFSFSASAGSTNLYEVEDTRVGCWVKERSTHGLPTQRKNQSCLPLQEWQKWSKMVTWLLFIFHQELYMSTIWVSRS